MRHEGIGTPQREYAPAIGPMPVSAATQDAGLSRATTLLFALAAGLSVANTYYAQPLLDTMARDFAALDISLIVPAISFGVGALPSWGAEAYADLKPVNALELLAEYQEAGVGRILVGLNDLEDDSAFAALEEAAKGLGLA